MCLFAYTNCGFVFPLYVQVAPWAVSLRWLVMTNHQVSDLESMEHVLSNHSGSQEFGIKVSAGLVPFIGRGREYVTCFSSPFCWLPGSAWHSLACVISLLSLSLYLCIFSHHPLLPDFFSYRNTPLAWGPTLYFRVISPEDFIPVPKFLFPS